ncbi:hypothetical protein JXA02_04005 [candidate division KSB1 bacterium]|nr:hypothetical protein [candidate division KSB1 bacterium]RQW09093.1 MAG: hypothetical protein EH222_04490 [candidate division KSB1 bacterium]
MSRFLIEVSHADDQEECLKVVHVFLSSGSHFLSNADWGCPDGEHKAWMIIDVAKKEDALSIVPPAFRNQAKITQLNKFSLDKIEKEMSMHRARV